MTIHDTDKGNKLHNTFKFEYLNAREIGVIVYDRYNIHYNTKGDITEVNTSKHSIKLKDAIILSLSTQFKTTHEVNKIYVANDTLYKYDFFISTGLINKTVQYIIPFLDNTAEYFSIRLRLLNAFVSHDNKYIFIRYRFSNSKDFNDLDRRLRGIDYFREIINDTKYSIIYKFVLRDIYTKDIKLILNGKYSDISELAKKKIISFHEEDNYVSGVLYKSSHLKSFLEEKLNCSIPTTLDLDDKPNKQLEIWPI